MSAVTAAMLAVTAALKRFSVLLVADHASNDQSHDPGKHCRRYDCSHKFHASRPLQTITILPLRFYYYNYIFAIAFLPALTLISSVLLSLYGLTSR